MGWGAVTGNGVGGNKKFTAVKVCRQCPPARPSVKVDWKQNETSGSEESEVRGSVGGKVVTGLSFVFGGQHFDGILVAGERRLRILHYMYRPSWDLTQNTVFLH